jgi:hypothetical protein
MTTTLDSLPADQRADFLKRLALYGLDETSILRPDLVIPPKTTLTLSTAANSFLRPHLLSTPDLDELKKWIGIPDQRFKQGLHEAPSAHIPVPKKIPATAHAAAGTSRPFASEDFNNIRAGAVAYLWGNSARAAALKPIVEEAFRTFEVALWPFFTITVKTGAVLEVGAGANVLCAWKIIIEEGGEVRGTNTNLHVQCTILQKEQLFITPIHGLKPVKHAKA